MTNEELNREQQLQDWDKKRELIELSDDDERGEVVPTLEEKLPQGYPQEY